MKPFKVCSEIFVNFDEDEALFNFGEAEKYYHKEIIGLFQKGATANDLGIYIQSDPLKVRELDGKYVFIEAADNETQKLLEQWLDTEAPALFQEYLNKQSASND